MTTYGAKYWRNIMSTKVEPEETTPAVRVSHLPQSKKKRTRSNKKDLSPKLQNLKGGSQVLSTIFSVYFQQILLDGKVIGTYMERLDTIDWGTGNQHMLQYFA